VTRTRPLRPRHLAWVLVGCALLGAACHKARPEVSRHGIVVTVGDVQALHADVRVGDREVRGSARLSDGDEVRTGPDGRARIRLDDGTVLVVDGSTELALHGVRVALARGRLFVQAGSASRTVVSFGGASTAMVGSAAAFAKGAPGGSGGADTVYCARGELVVNAAGKQEHVASGETATLAEAGPHVAPEAAFDDWTGGLAVPWAGERGPASAIGEAWGGTGGDDPGSPLVVRSEKVDVVVEGEVAVTHARTTYFNGGDRDVVADVRMALRRQLARGRRGRGRIADVQPAGRRPLRVGGERLDARESSRDRSRKIRRALGRLRRVAARGGRASDLPICHVERARERRCARARE